jgi:hypothetical protein
VRFDANYLLHQNGSSSYTRCALLNGVRVCHRMSSVPAAAATKAIMKLVEFCIAENLQVILTLYVIVNISGLPEFGLDGD